MRIANWKDYSMIGVFIIIFFIGCKGPPAPKNVMAENQDMEIKEKDNPFVKISHTKTEAILVSWEPVDGAEKYFIYWSTKPDVAKNNGKQATRTSNAFRHEDPTFGKTYYYVVTAVKDGKESPESMTVQATPKARKRKAKFTGPVSVGDSTFVPPEDFNGDHFQFENGSGEKIFISPE